MRKLRAMQLKNPSVAPARVILTKAHVRLICASSKNHPPTHERWCLSVRVTGRQLRLISFNTTLAGKSRQGFLRSKIWSREMENVINLTKFKTTSELERFGVTCLRDWKAFQEIRNLLFFPNPPTREQVDQRVERLVQIALAESQRTGTTTVLVGCPPWMMQKLCAELIYFGLKPVVTFTKKTMESGLTVVSLVDAA